MRARIALISYWALFIIAPLCLFLVWRGFTVLTELLALLLFLLLAALGERGFGQWKRLWRIS